MSFAAAVIGASAGGFEAIEAVCRQLPANFAPPIFIVQHLHASDTGQFAEHLGIVVALPVVEARDKMKIARSHIYVAPANYHLLIEDAETLALSIDPPVYCSRPAIDALFESAARVWGEDLVAVLLSGASRDGTAGLRAVKESGGRTFAQDPNSAEAPVMPMWAIQSSVVDEVLTPAAIGAHILALARGERI
jgi:two-component system chemotaxis response regulator CheB